MSDHGYSSVIVPAAPGFWLAEDGRIAVIAWKVDLRTDSNGDVYTRSVEPVAVGQNSDWAMHSIKIEQPDGTIVDPDTGGVTRP